jgi:hypothetical protein
MLINSLNILWLYLKLFEKKLSDVLSKKKIVTRKIRAVSGWIL